MDVEFKLFAGLTVKQFAGLAMWLFFALFLYLLNLPPLIGYPLILLAVFLGLAFAFMRIQNQPFSTWLTNFILAMIKPQRKVWKKSPTPPKALVQDFSVPKHSNNSSERVRGVPKSIVESVMSKNRPDEILDQYEVGRFKMIDRHLNKSVTPKKIIQEYKQGVAQKQVTSNQNKPPVEEVKIKSKEEEIPKQVVKTPDTTQVSEKIDSQNSTEVATKPKKEEDEVRNNVQEVEVEKEIKKGNTVLGQVLTKEGQPAPNMRVQIYDANAQLIRQSATNAQGAFSIRTPLVDGAYIVRVEGGSQQKFQSMNLDLKGGIQKELILYEL